MAIAYTIPFEWNPTSTTIKTGAYTVPTGSRARVRPTSLETDFTIDTVIAVEAVVYTGSSTTNGTFFTNTTCYTLVGSCSTTTSGSGGAFKVEYPSNTQAMPYSESSWGAGFTDTVVQASLFSQNTSGPNPSSPSMAVTVPANCKITYANSTNRVYHLHAKTVYSPDWFWVPEDTDLDGTRYVVELYANIA
jgi:hypothetical protein